MQSNLDNTEISKLANQAYVVRSSKASATMCYSAKFSVFAIICSFLIGRIGWTNLEAASFYRPTSPTAFDCSKVREVPKTECQVLIILYNQTNGSGWTHNDNWLQNTKVCSWHGVVCTNARVAALKLDVNELSGTIPSEIGQLSSLVELNLFANHLTGSIPPSLGRLSQLTDLDLARNNLEGPIPLELGGLTNLIYLGLSRNQLTGVIPVELCRPPHLNYLSLAYNNLSGSIPAQMGNLTNLQELYLDGNQLSGEIPAQLANLQIMMELSLKYNKLTASDPVLLAFLGDKEADWAMTQRVAPTAVQVTSTLTNTLTVTWTPVRFQSSGGYYEVSYATSGNGPYTVHGITIDKRANQYILTNLQGPVTNYFVRVRTYTPAGGGDVEWWSDYSNIVFIPTTTVYLPHVEN